MCVLGRHSKCLGKTYKVCVDKTYNVCVGKTSDECWEENNMCVGNT